MVNIQSVVAVTNEVIEAYSSWPAFFAAKMNSLVGEGKARQEKLNSVSLAEEINLGKMYKIPTANMRHAIILFGTIRNARLRLADEYIRNLVCNPEHRIVLQIWHNATHCTTTCTVYRRYDCETITTLSPHSEAILSGLTNRSEP